MRTLFAEDFAAAAPPLELGDDEIHLWIFPWQGIGAEKSGTPPCLRQTLAAYLGVDADDLRIERNAAGKPYLADAALEFNISHSDDALLIGLSRGQELGVDIEGGGRVRPYLEIARRYFTVDEAAALARLPGDRLARSFIELWSAKEAVLKAIGRGIAFGLDRVGFELDGEGRTRRLLHLAAEAGTPAQWRLVRLSPQAGITGALAWRGPEMRLRAFAVAAPSRLRRSARLARP
ncbi:MAG: 4'-phosphopantetheinyl transferase superfamily protein [Proteobacteria bacterium]|nr:4'-phosphopantetheinyl transferase superfamily protein [Pseudomonadota bacterium]